MESKESTFCKLYSDFHGEKIDSIKQITHSSFNGEDLLDFCEEYKNLCFKEAIKRVEGYSKIHEKTIGRMTDHEVYVMDEILEILKEEINEV